MQNMRHAPIFKTLKKVMPTTNMTTIEEARRKNMRNLREHWSNISLFLSPQFAR